MSDPRYLDNSQYTTFQRCPALWYEQYVRGLRPNYTGQRNDPLCLGALYHSALQEFYHVRRPQPTAEVIAEFDPTPDALADATRWAHAYVATHPADPWRVELVETACIGPQIGGRDDYRLLAKLDTVVELTAHLRLSGPVGFGDVAPPGLYSLEHKTRSTSGSREDYVRRWLSDTQAIFQLECARPIHKLDGVIVNVCDKPYAAPPRRKCRNASCGETQPFTDFVPVDRTVRGKPQFRCTLCGGVSQFDPPEPKAPPEPSFWRFLVTRTQAQIDAAYREFEYVVGEMEAIRAGRPPHRSLGLACEDYHRWCSFYEHHVNLTDPALSQGFVQIDDPLHYVWR